MKKINLLGMLVLSFILESCSYSSPKEAYDANIIGKNALQKTDATTSRRYPAGNNPYEDSSSKSDKTTNLKKKSNDYDAYQHYQSAKPPKKAKRRPILNLKELNDLMDREATITLTERRKKSDTKPQIDENSNIQEVIEYNKSQKTKNKPKQRVKVLVVKEDKNSSKTADTATTSKDKSKATSESTNKTSPQTKETNTIEASKSKSKTTTTSSSAVASDKTKAKTSAESTTNVKTIASTDKTISKKPTVKKRKIVDTSTLKAVNLPEPNIVTPPPAITSNKVVTPSSDNIKQNNVVTKTPKASTTESINNTIVAEPKDNAMSSKLETLAPVDTPKTTEIKGQVDTTKVETLSPVDSSTETEMNPVDLSTDTVDTSNMTQQELEQHLKAKFREENNNLDPIVEDSNIGTDSQIDEIDTSSDTSDSQPMIPLPAIPSASESMFSDFASRFNEILITYYYKVKLSIMIFISSIFGLDW